MGNQESTGGQEDPQQILDSLTVIKKFTDQRFGDSSLVEHKETKQQFILREMNTTEQEEHKNNLAKYQERLQLQHPNTVQLLKCFGKTDSQFCSTFYKTYLLFEYLENSLEKEIQARKEQQAFFSEGELWNAMGGAIQGLAFLQKNGIAHNCIRTSTIYFNEEGQPKVTDPTVFMQLNNFATTCQDQENVPSGIYLAPSLMEALEQQNWSPEHNEFKSDVFSFGMTLLSMGLLENLDDCYNYADGSFLSQQLENRLIQFSQRYSQDLTQFILLMLKTEEDHRFDFLQLEEILISQPQNSPEKDQNQDQIQSQNQSPEQQKFSQYSAQNQSPQQQHQEHNVSNQSHQRQQLSQLPPQQNLQQSYQQGNGPASFMMKDQPDLGSSKNNAPQENIAGPNQPDENIGNEIGGNYQEDEEQDQEYHQQSQEQPQQQQQQNNNYYQQQQSQVQQQSQNQVPQQQQSYSQSYQQSQITQSNTYSNNYYKPYQQQEVQPQQQKEQDYIPLPGEKKAQPQYQQYQQYQQQQQGNQNLESILNKYSNTGSQQKQQQPQQQQSSITNTYTASSYQIPYNNNQSASNQYQQSYQQANQQLGGLNINNTNSNKNLNDQKDLQKQPQTQTYTNSYTSPYQGYYQSSQQVPQQQQVGYQQSTQIQQNTQSSNMEQKEYVVENYQNGSRYEGEKLNGQRHGSGKFYYQDNGGLYDGNWRYNKMHGKGILYYASGKKAYDGDWVEDKFQGFGVLYNENPAVLQGNFDYKDFDLVEEFWTRYDGEFNDDNKEGYGTLYLSNNEKFSGNFKKDFVSGQGTFYTSNQQIIRGIWENNKLVQTL